MALKSGRARKLRRRNRKQWERRNAATLVTRQLSPQELEVLRADRSGLDRRRGSYLT